MLGLLCGELKGTKPISHLCLLYCAITIYQHDTLRVSFESFHIDPDINAGIQVLHNITKVDGLWLNA